ncbi:GNAT family N-acetyltransferase [[Actinomadura] parvosata]|uniref:GNAT family N-acetyltransferase n=1 Tax=[Actinomadura] parvosata TaxID=1955412 RepID=UPI00406D0342
MSHSRTLSAAEIPSERLLLRRALRATDREAFVELSTDPEVQSYLGGPRPRSEVAQRFERVLAGSGEARPGNYAIADRATDRFLGTLMLAHRPPGGAGQAGGRRLRGRQRVKAADR